MVQEIVDQPRLMKILLHLYEARDMVTLNSIKVLQQGITFF